MKDGKQQVEQDLKRMEENAMRVLTGGCPQHKDMTFDEFETSGGTGCPICLTEQIAELKERVEMLNHIALSAIALKLNIENGFPPTLHALNRDLALYQVRFGGVVEMVGKAALAIWERPANYGELTPEQQWEIDKKLGILDWDGKR